MTALTGVALLTLRSCASIPEGAIAIRPFDKEKYLGKWYEIARMDFRFERNLNNVTATYTLKDNGSIKVDNRGFDYLTKEWKQAIGKAKFAGSPDEARLKVSFFGPFYSGYNVIALDDQYKYALIAGQNLKYLWMLSRETTMPESTKQSYLDIAKGLGYDVSALIWTEHDKK
jgi:apolipoprotein D and lipocalin family protein